MKARIAEFSIRLWRRIQVLPPGLQVAIIVVLLLGARPAWTFIHRPAHLDEIAAECGSVHTFFRVPTTDQTGTRIAYSRTTENWVGTLLYNDVTGERQLIYTNHARNSMPWSPDGLSFAYARTFESATPIIAIYWPDTRKTQLIPCAVASTFAWPNTDFICSWLTPDSFVYTGDPMEMHWVRKQTDGQWKDTVRFVPSQVTNAPAFMTAMSDKNIIWQQGNTLWTLDVPSTNPPVKFFQLSTNSSDLTKLTGVSYSPETRQFLLNCTGTNDGSLWRLTPGDPSSENPSRIMSDNSIRDAKWINEGKGYAYINQDKSLVVRMELSAKSVTLFSEGNVTAFKASPNGKRLFIVGVMSNEFAPSLWQYNVEPASLQCVEPFYERSLQFAKGILPTPTTFDSSSGQKIAFNLYLPPDFNPKHRYPLVFLTRYTINFASAFANCGVICAYVERSGSRDKETIDKWENAVLEVSGYLAENHFTDAKQIFIASASGETQLVGEFCAKHPNLWKGMILMNPSGFSDVKALTSGWRTPKILISAGQEESSTGNDEWIRQYQKEAYKAGVETGVFIIESERHVFMSESAKSERMKEIMNFIFND